MKIFVQKLLYLLARQIIRYHQPEVIAVTGSVGKTSTKEAIFAVLSSQYSVRTNRLNYNNELGVPLTIIGADNGGKNALKWLGSLVKGLAYAILPLPYPRILVLEMGADRPGDIRYLTQLAPAHVGIVTRISDQPVHLEFFKDVDQLAQEKNIMYRHLSKTDWAVLNLDEPYTVALLPKLKSYTISYAVHSSQADLQAFDIDYSTHPTNDPMAEIEGLRFKVRYLGNTVPVFIPQVVGLPSVYAALCAMTVGSIYQMNLIDIAAALQRYQPPPGRLRLIRGKNHTLLIDDTYNSSPAAVQEALQVVQQMVTSGKKIVCLGNMEELGIQSKRAHTLVGKRIAELDVNYLLTVGEKAEGIAHAALDNGMPPEQIFTFQDIASLIKQLQPLLQPLDMVLIKGSQSMRMERVVQALMEQPEQASTLLVRQYGHWTR